MKLLKCYVENFGMLHEYSCKFSSGLNSIYSKNGTGKTTFTVFIKSMLYGLSDTRKVSIEENDRKKYYPWQGGAFGGSLTFEAKGRRYTVERRFGIRPADDTFKLLNFDTGSVSYDFSENLGEELFSLDRDGYERTVFLSEKNLSVKNNNKTISAKLSNLVGTDADMGELDSAIKLLEEKRKFYYKKGGSGEIENVKDRLLQTQREIEQLKQLKKTANSTEERLQEYEHNITLLEEQRKTLNSNIKELNETKIQKSYEEQYSSMQNSIFSELNAQREIVEFFGGNVPTVEEINEIRCLQIEKENLSNYTYSNQSEEFNRLKNLFKSETNFEEISKYGEVLDRLTKSQNELELIESGKDSDSIKQKTLFAVRVPKEDEIKKNIKKQKNCSKMQPIVVILISIFVLVSSFFFVSKNNTLFTALLATSLLMLAIGSLMLFVKVRRKNSVLKFVSDFPNYNKETKIIDFLNNLQSDLKVYQYANQNIEKRKEELKNIISNAKSEVTEYLARFSVIVSDDLEESFSKLKAEYSKYYTLKTNISEGGCTLNTSRLNEIQERLNTFYGQHCLLEDANIDELNAKVLQYNYKTEVIEKMKNNANAFAETHEFKTQSTYENLDFENVNMKIGLVEEKIRKQREELALLSKEYSYMCEKIDRLEEKEALADELEVILKKYSSNLSTIQKTTALLKESAKNMNSRYLGKTQSNFLKYKNLICNDGDEFAIDSSFALSKAEHGTNRSLESFSRGKIDIYSFALRLALCDSLYENEKPFIILDDAFISLDDEKCEEAKRLIAKIAEEKQILYFTCSKSRAI